MARTKIRGNTQIIDGTILNAQIGASANIATSKLAEGAEFLKRDGSVAMTGNLDANSNRIVNLAAPVDVNDAARKADVELASLGLDVKGAVRAASTTNLTLSGEQTVDGVALVAGDRVLVKDQTDAEDNGIYVVSAGAWSRSADANTSALVVPNMFMFVSEGTTQDDTGWVLITNAPITLGTTELDFTQFSGVGSGGDVDSGANVGDNGTGLFKNKTGSTLNFHKLNNTDGKINIALDGGSDEVRLAIVADSLVNADISASASIARSKLASGTAHRLVVNNASGVMVDASEITADRALISDANGIPTHSAVTATELGHLSGVTSAIQTQLDTKLENADVNAKFITREIPTGDIDGVNDEFELANTPVAGSEHVFLNGQLQRPGATEDYTISGDTITFNDAPLTDDTLVVSYMI